MVKISEKLKEIRKLAELSQEELASKIRMTKPNYSRIERDMQKISYDALFNLVTFLNIDARYFFNQLSLEEAIDNSFVIQLNISLKEFKDTEYLTVKKDFFPATIKKLKEEEISSYLNTLLLEAVLLQTIKEIEVNPLDKLLKLQTLLKRIKEKREKEIRA